MPYCFHIALSGTNIISFFIILTRPQKCVNMYFLIQICFFTFCSKLSFCLILFRNTSPWSTLRLLRVSYFNAQMTSLESKILFPFAPRWLWWGNSYFDRTKWNSGSSIGLIDSYERSPQYAFNKTWETDRDIMIVKKTREQDFPM